MKKIFNIFCILFIFCILPYFTFAEESSESFAKKVFLKLDTNKDNIVDKKDIERYSKIEFKKIDKNKDNYVSKEEFFNFVCEESCNSGSCECKDYKNKEDLFYMKNYWERIDSNKDSKITEKESLEDNMNVFSSLDQNNDGKITKQDIETQLY